mmetsp:Transcript_21634/g.37959  ORF Transcript_21634/g.37959 Transcript_21634/m.37959 type:complete len:584 (+) Transcript_21634:135-1886(+)
MDVDGKRGSVSSGVTVGLPDESFQSGAPVFISQKATPLVDTDRFAAVMGAIVLINVVTIGFETDAPQDGDLPAVFGVINNAFLLAYIIELMLRLLTHGIHALRDPFTVMDAVLVLCSFLERVLNSGGFARALPAFRMLRLIRLLRATRLLRYNHELNVLSAAGVRVMKTLFWVVVFLAMIVWSVACFANIVLGESAEWNETMDPNKDPPLPPFRAFHLREYFGSLARSYLTLIQVVTVSQWAPHVARPVVQVYPTTVLFFVCFIVVVTFGLVVTIVSNLVQDSMSASRDNAKALKEVAKEERKKIGYQARDILAQVDSDGSGDLSAAEIEVALKVTNLGDILRELGVPVLEPENLVRLLDFDGSGTVSFDELVEGVIKMDEEISSRDYQFMAFWLWNLLMRTKQLEERLDKLVDQISDIRYRLKMSFGKLDWMIRTQGASSLRRRALHIIRTSGPSLPPSLHKKRKNLGPDYAVQDQATEFMAFARRFFQKSDASRSKSEGQRMPRRSQFGDEYDYKREALRAAAGSREIMPPAPPRYEVARKEAKEKELTYDENKYMLSRGDLQSGAGFQPNKSLAVWREMF